MLLSTQPFVFLQKSSKDPSMFLRSVVCKQVPAVSYKCRSSTSWPPTGLPGLAIPVGHGLDPRSARLARWEQMRHRHLRLNVHPRTHITTFILIYIEREIDTVDSAGHLVDKSPNCISTHFLSGLLWSLTGYDSMSIGAINLQH